MRVLLITSDAFGGRGGIAQYNRDLSTALATMPEAEEVVVVPRNLHDVPGIPPPKISLRAGAASGKPRFVLEALSAARSAFDLLVCGHVNLLPVAVLLKYRLRAPLVLLVYGIEVWKPHRSRLVRRLLPAADAVWSISETTRDRLASWWRPASGEVEILPNAIDLGRYAPGARSARLLERYDLVDRRIMMILCRLHGSERRKGVDELLELLPRLVAREPRLVFLVVGDGDDRARLQRKATGLGIGSHVVFTGFIPENEKVDHYRLADVFVMPSRGEGFGFVFLEALACGVPVVASTADGGREAVRHGALGRMVDPDDRDALEAAIVAALGDRHRVPEGLDYFAIPRFQARVADATRRALSRRAPPPR